MTEALAEKVKKRHQEMIRKCRYCAIFGEVMYGKCIHEDRYYRTKSYIYKHYANWYLRTIKEEKGSHGRIEIKYDVPIMCCPECGRRLKDD